MRRAPVFLLSVLLVVAGAAVSPTADAAPGSGREGAGPKVWVGDLTAAQVALVRQAGADAEDLVTARSTTAGRSKVEVILSQESADKLAAQGVALSEKTVDGQTVSARLAAQAASGFSVFRSYSEPGGIRDELVETARANPRIAKLVTIGRTVTGQAVPSYAPRNAAEYFRKLECFCFTKQTLQPGERRRMPVVFVLDRELPPDVHTITLSYTFFEVEGGSAGEPKGSAARG